MYMWGVVFLLSYSLLMTSAQPSKSCPITGCLTGANPNAPGCIESAANVRKCVDDGLQSPDICKCDESLVRTYHMYAGGAAAACKAPECGEPEIVQCSQYVASAFMGGESAEKAVQCMEKYKDKMGRCMRGPYSTASVITDKDMEDILDINIDFYKLLAKGCSMVEPTQNCVNAQGFGSDACTNVDVTVNMQECMKREAIKQGAVCNGVDDLLDAGMKYMKRHILDPACEKQKEVDQLLLKCGSQSTRDTYATQHHRLARGGWPLFL